MNYSTERGRVKFKLIFVFMVTVYIYKKTLPKFLRNSLLKNVSLHRIKGPAYLESFGNLGRKHNLREQILY